MRGVWTALVTPFKANQEVDLDAYKRILHDQRDAGVAGVIPCGTTGETPTLSIEEKKLLIQIAIQEMKGTQVGVVAGTGSNNTRETVEFSGWASEQGVSGVLVVTPYYNKPTQEGMRAHYSAIAERVKCPVVVYNVPGRTGVSLTADTIVEMADHPRLRVLKEATGNVAFTSEILDQLHRQRRYVDILSGDDATYLPLLAVGAVGVISVASNLIPRAMVALQKAMDQGKVQEAQKIHAKYYPLFRDLFIESNPVPVKYAMARIGLCEAHVRMPLVPLTELSKIRLDATLESCGFGPGHGSSHGQVEMRRL